MDNITRRKSLKIIGALGFATVLSLRTIGKTISDACEVCKEAWQKLSKFNAQRYQFRYIEPKAGLPKVFIYGDSISIGYTEYVRASLEGKANVYRLHVNGGSSGGFIHYMEAFRKAMFQPDFEQGWDFEWDVIHFNVGLHDLKYLLNGKLDKEKGIQVSSLTVYEQNLQEIVKYLKSTYPKAKLIFATTTPVPEGEPGRIAGDEKRYNEVALKVLQNYNDVIVNDLCKFSISVLNEYAAGPGNVHYKDEGSRMQGIEVARVIAKVIGVVPVKCPSAETIKELFKKYEEQ